MGNRKRDAEGNYIFHVGKGYTKEDLKERIHSVFQESGVAVWDCELI